MAMFIIVGTANAVNVTDGLDGLAGGLLVFAFAAFGILAWVEGLSVLAAFCAVTAGAIAAFLWHNVPPALFYMGDTGSLALGGTLGAIALMTDQVIFLALVGAVFVIEMLSVIIQLTSKRLRGGKKNFKAAAHSSSFRSAGVGREQGDDAFLDHRRVLRVPRHRHRRISTQQYQAAQAETVLELWE